MNCIKVFAYIAEFFAFSFAFIGLVLLWTQDVMSALVFLIDGVLCFCAARTLLEVSEDV